MRVLGRCSCVHRAWQLACDSVSSHRRPAVRGATLRRLAAAAAGRSVSLGATTALPGSYRAQHVSFILPLGYPAGVPWTERTRAGSRMVRYYCASRRSACACCLLGFCDLPAGRSSAEAAVCTASTAACSARAGAEPTAFGRLLTAAGDYCDSFLTHDSPAVRKQHNSGYKHKSNVKAYYLQVGGPCMGCFALQAAWRADGCGDNQACCRCWPGGDELTRGPPPAAACPCAV